MQLFAFLRRGEPGALAILAEGLIDIAGRTLCTIFLMSRSTTR